MTLTALIRKRETGKVATAIPAIFATHPGEEVETVAGIATVAVATPTEPGPMGNRERDAIRAWLDYIEEHDSVTITEILDKCDSALAARRYFLERSKDGPYALG